MKMDRDIDIEMDMDMDMGIGKDTDTDMNTATDMGTSPRHLFKYSDDRYRISVKSLI